VNERFVGIDVGGTHVRSARYRDEDARPVLERVIDLPADYPAFLAALVDLAGPGATAVGIGLPGRVTGERVEWVPNVPYLDGRSLVEDMTNRLGAPVRLVNDGQAAMLGEARFGAARDVSDAILVTIGTGIGGAVLRNRRVVRGARGTAGAFGWLMIGGLAAEAADLDTHASDPTVGPQRGPWEERASGRALARSAAALVPALTATDLLASARAGHAGAASVLEHFSHDLGRGLAVLASVFDPQRILISGGVSELVQALLPDVTGTLVQFSSPSVRDISIVIAEHGARAGVFGAAALAREREGAFLA
jgi:predicted NBD/HSP70 family sugar kinase